ncbi:MAG: histidine phosphatase family protein [Actinomycetota bacterium]|nr:histidine phosphatase family protein [Actinomycetota bacterium]
MLLLLVRHAITGVTGQKLTGRLPGFSLSEEGRAQAEAVGARLKGAPLNAIYSSPLERCMETAESIAKHHRVRVESLADMEEVDYGRWQGRSMKALYGSKAWTQLRARPADFRFPGGETIREAQVRGMRAVEALRQKHPKRAVLVCSHADMIRLVVAGYLGLGLDLYDRISIAPASVTTLNVGDGTPRLLNLGDSGSMLEIFEAFKAQHMKKARDSKKRR